VLARRLTARAPQMSISSADQETSLQAPFGAGRLSQTAPSMILTSILKSAKTSAWLPTTVTIPILLPFFVQCERATELQADCAHAFMASRVSGPPPSPAPSAAASVDRYFPVESAAADRERTRRFTDFYFSFD